MLTPCSKCGGAVYPESDEYGHFTVCINCGKRIHVDYYKSLEAVANDNRYGRQRRRSGARIAGRTV